MTAIKILVAGDVEGSFQQLFKRVESVNKKSGPFSMVLSVGEFFHWNKDEFELYKKGHLKAPLPTYILGPIKEDVIHHYTDMRGCELAENIIYLGPHGVYSCSNGLKIAYLSGSEASANKSTDTTFTAEDIKALELSAGNKPKIDILITSQWPCDVSNFAIAPKGVDVYQGSPLISYLAYKLKPRYHFCASLGVHYERLPYRNHQVLKEAAQPTTRFIAMAKLGNPEKLKWLYAFNISPSLGLEHEELVRQPPDVTENPYSDRTAQYLLERLNKKESTNEKQYFYDMKPPQTETESHKRKGKQDPRPKKVPKATGPCWFCLSSPDVEKHLIVSVGSYSYIALAKGGLVSFHLLILPIEHYQSTPELEEECLTEINKFKSSLKKMFKKKGQVVVFFERNYKTQHLQIQVVPLLEKLEPQIKETFMDLAEASGFSLDELPQHSELGQIANPGVPFFYVELPCGKKLYHRIRKGFELQFGREVLASPPLLNIPERVDWRTCKMDRSEETALRNAVRKHFKPFDFTLEDDDSD